MSDKQHPRRLVSQEIGAVAGVLQNALGLLDYPVELAGWCVDAAQRARDDVQSSEELRLQSVEAGEKKPNTTNLEII